MNGRRSKVLESLAVLSIFFIPFRAPQVRRPVERDESGRDWQSKTAADFGGLDRRAAPSEDISTVI
jgi:hypothetical protein